MLGGAGTLVLSNSKKYKVGRCKKGSRRNKKTGLCVKNSGSLANPRAKSNCVGYSQQECNTRVGCSYANGPKRKFCRKSPSKPRLGKVKRSFSSSIDFGSSHRSSLNSILTSSSIRRPTRRHRSSSHRSSLNSILTSSSIRRPTRRRHNRRRPIKSESGSNSFKSANSSTKSYKSTKASPANKWEAI